MFRIKAPAADPTDLEINITPNYFFYAQLDLLNSHIGFASLNQAEEECSTTRLDICQLGPIITFQVDESQQLLVVLTLYVLFLAFRTSLTPFLYVGLGIMCSI